jgi:hypothetical protein
MRAHLKWLVLPAMAMLVITTVPGFTSSSEKKVEKKQKKAEREEKEKEKGGAPVKVTVKGTLKTGVTFPAKETTGTEITVAEVKGINWELDFSDAKELSETAKKLNGKEATATGNLEVRPGQFRKLRFLIKVNALK